MTDVNTNIKTPLKYRCVTPDPPPYVATKFDRAAKKKKPMTGDKGGRPQIEINLEELIRLRKKGMGLKPIANILGCSVVYVFNHIPEELKGDWDKEAGEFRERLKKGK